VLDRDAKGGDKGGGGGKKKTGVELDDVQFHRAVQVVSTAIHLHATIERVIMSSAAGQIRYRQNHYLCATGRRVPANDVSFMF
jgi:hypothetical protein